MYEGNPTPMFSPPPASGPAPASVGNTGVIYGEQNSRTIKANSPNGGAQDAIDVVKAPFLWRFSVFGRVFVRVTYGTKTTRQYVDLRAPVIMTVPGQLTVTVRPINPEGDTDYSVTLTAATGSARSSARKIIDATIAPVLFSEDAAFFTALSASTLTIAGLPVSVAATQTVPLVSGSVLLTGTGFQEFEA